MTALNKQALRQLATDAHELGIIKRYTKGIEANKKFVAAVNPTTVLALLDELEAAQKYAKDRDAENEDLMLTVGRLRMEKEVAEKRIAELEARTVKLPTSTKVNGFQMLIEEEVIARLRESGVNPIVVRAAGIGVRGE